MIRITTSEGARIVPEWAKCYCVARHTPTYIHPYPFALPDGREIWLCPNTYHQATTLRGIYLKLNGPPKGQLREYSSFVKRLLKMYWQQKMTEDVSVERRAVRDATDIEKIREMQEMFKRAKKVVLDGCE